MRARTTALAAMITLSYVVVTNMRAPWIWVVPWLLAMICFEGWFRLTIAVVDFPKNKTKMDLRGVSAEAERLVSAGGWRMMRRLS